MDNTRHLNRTISLGLLVCVAFTALAFGAVEPWSIFVFEILVIGLVLLWAVKVLKDGRLKLVVPRVAAPVAVLLAFGLIQSVAFTGADGQVRSLSMNVGATRVTVTVLAFMLVSLVLAVNFLDTRERLALAAHFLVVFGLGLSIFALVQHVTWSGEFYWIRPTLVTSPFGPFANHNHFAGYMVLLIPVPLGLVLTRAVRGEMRLLYGFAAAMMGLAAVVSLSRGGMIALGAMIMFILLMSIRKAGASRRASERGQTPIKRNESGRLRRLASQAMIGIVLVAVIGAGVIWIGADPVIQRVTQSQPGQEGTIETFSTSRGWIWRDTITMIAANPVFGVGLGAYGTAFNIYTQSDGSLRVSQAHNDFLQIVADCGIVGGVIALWFIIIAFRAVGDGLGARDRLLWGLSLASGAGIFGILVHSLFDFNLQIPSNGLLFLVLVATASNAARIAREFRKHEELASSHDVAALAGQTDASAALAGGR